MGGQTDREPPDGEATDSHTTQRCQQAQGDTDEAHEADTGATERDATEAEGADGDAPDRKSLTVILRVCLHPRSTDSFRVEVPNRYPVAYTRCRPNPVVQVSDAAGHDGRFLTQTQVHYFLPFLLRS